MDIVITQTGAHEDHLYSVGDTLSFNIDVTNLATEARSFTVDETDLGGDVKKCRWSRIEANAKKTDCVGYATHTVTEEDLTGGSFTPEISYKTQQPSYQGEALNTPETIRGDAVPLKASQITVESMTVSDPKDAYKEGDTVEVVVRVRSHSKDTIDVATTSSSFDDLTTQCNWGSLAPGAGAVYNCKPLHHTITAEDVKTGSYTPSITLTASKGGEVLQTLTPTGEALAVQGVYPEATPAPLPDASVSLPASMSEGASVATGTAADNVRIPAITTAPNGDLLVSYDQRPLTGWDASGNDSPNPNSIVQRRSTDGGKNWGPVTYIHKGEKASKPTRVGYSDPSYIVDAETGAIFNFHVKSFDVGFAAS
ncbi:sialidase family protein [Actinomyces timonensis]|uniref:sialidase family protein n=1 Tax=Actinomyces timonensis TaxID=1288391 RepID=UPI0002FBEEF3|nr:sialidase family protein [Actinomyces timonensis]